MASKKPSLSEAVVPGHNTPLGKVQFGGQANKSKFQRGRNVSFNAGQTQKAPDVLAFTVALGNGKVENVEVKGIVVRGTINDGDIVGVIDAKRKGDVYRTKKVWNFTRSSPVTGSLLGALRRR